MSEKICPAPECNNTVWSNKATYCSGACKQRAMRARKKNGISVNAISGRNQKIQKSGDITTDLSRTAIQNVIGNAISGSSGMTNGMTNDLVKVGIPYISDCCTKRPVKTLLGFVVGVATAGFVLSKCKIVKKGNSRTKTCTKPSGVQRVASGAVLAIGTNVLLDNLPKVQEYASNVTVALRNGYVTEPVTEPVIPTKNVYFSNSAN